MFGSIPSGDPAHDLETVMNEFEIMHDKLRRAASAEVTATDRLEHEREAREAVERQRDVAEASLREIRATIEVANRRAIVAAAGPVGAPA